MLNPIPKSENSEITKILKKHHNTENENVTSKTIEINSSYLSFESF